MLVEKSVIVSIKCKNTEWIYTPRVEPAHGMITLHTAIHNRSVSLLCNALLGNFRINPIRKSPHAGVNLSKLHRRARIICDSFLEGRIEVAIIKENIWVVIPPVEM